MSNDNSFSFFLTTYLARRIFQCYLSGSQPPPFRCLGFPSKLCVKGYLGHGGMSVG